MAPRISRFHVVRKETRGTLLCRVHRCLLNTAADRDLAKRQLVQRLHDEILHEQESDC